MILITGGVATTLSVGAAEGSKADALITAKIKSVLLAHPDTFGVSADTRNGVVTLGGTLPSQSAIDHVKGLAGKAEGVKRVDAAALAVAHI